MIKAETICSFHTRTDDGLFVVRMKEGVSETIEMARENGQALMRLLGDDAPLPLLIDFTLGSGQDSETRQYYANHSGDWCTKAAILVNSPVARVMGNIYMGLNKPKVPTRLFTLEEAAMAWLKND